MPRRTRPARGRRARKAKAAERETIRAPEIVTGAPEGWQVRVIRPDAATKEYRCPGCNQEIRRGTRHVVAWRTGEEAHRRHWHTPCWERRRRGD